MSKKLEENKLFDEKIINGIKIKPWSFGILFDISSKLERILDVAEAKGVIKNIEESGYLSYITMVKLFTLASSEFLSIVSMTVDMEEEEIKALDMDTGLKVSYTIITQNWDIIKNVLSSLLPAAPENQKK